MELTLGAALVAGLVSFLSPCVLPVVPAYLGQLGVIVATSVSPAVVAVGRGGFAPAGGAPFAAPLAAPTSLSTPAEIATSSPSGTWGRATGWRAIPNAIAFVAGFTVIFTLLGLALSGVLAPLKDNQALIRQVGGVILIVLGLNLMGIVRFSRLANTWRPVARFIAPSGRVGPQRGVLGGLALGAIFAIGWTPCIGPTLGAVLTLAVAGPSPQVVALLVAYSLGLGIPFILLAIAVDRAPSITRPLVAHGHTMELIGGALVVVIGVALLFDWLGVIARQFSALWPQV